MRRGIMKQAYNDDNNEPSKWGKLFNWLFILLIVAGIIAKYFGIGK